MLEEAPVDMTVSDDENLERSIRFVLRPVTELLDLEIWGALLCFLLSNSGWTVLMPRKLSFYFFV